MILCEKLNCFRKTLNINEEKISNPERKVKIKKWSQRAASMVAIVSLSMSVGFLIFNSTNPNVPQLDYYHLLCNNADFTQKCSLLHDCKVECRCIDENEENESIEIYINAALESKHCPSISLEIRNTIFQQFQLTHGWLTNIPTEVQELIIEKSMLSRINEKAFAEHPFQGSLANLKIIDATLEILTKHSFLGLDTLNNFEFLNYNDFIMLEIEENVLEGMSTTLKKLNLSGFIFSAADIINLTGNKGAHLPNLQILDLSYNALQELGNYSFINAPNVQLLYLCNIGLKKIHQNAFWGENTIQHLNLTINYLETLPEDAFQNLTSLSNEGIELWGNKWKCNCALEWLQDYYINTNYINKTNPPLCHGEDKKFEEVEFCPGLTSTTIRVPTEFIKIKCRNQKLNPIVVPLDIKIDLTHRVEVIIKNKSVELEFHELEGDPLQVQLKTEQNLSAYHLLWFNSDNKEENGCITPIENEMVLSELKRSTTYSLSLLYGDESEVSPKCTFCIITQPEWKERPWITNKFQGEVIAVTVFTVIFLICLTVFITFLCIRHHPTLIASNKSVVIIKSKKNSKKISPPKKEEEKPYEEPYVVSSNYGYITPKQHRFAKVKHRPQFRRSVSELNMNAPSQSEYIEPTQLQTLEMLQLESQNSVGLIETDTYDYISPLPPSNSKSKRFKVVQDPEEDFYSVI